MTMEKQGRLASGQGAAWHQIVLALTVLLLFMNGDPVSARSDDAAFDFVWAETYAGVFAGYG